VALVDGPQESLECPVGSRQARDDFRDPHDGNLVSIHFGLDSGVTHRFATAAENLRATQANFQSGGEPGSVNIARPRPQPPSADNFSTRSVVRSCWSVLRANGEPFHNSPVDRRVRRRLWKGSPLAPE